MLRSSLVHPEILSGLASAGHGALILVTDGNYPTSTTRGPNAVVVHLNLTRGTLDAPTIVRALAGASAIEEAIVMGPADEAATRPAIWQEFERALSESGSPLALRSIGRAAFYELASTPEVCLIVVSGDDRLFGNVFLRIGLGERD